MPKTYYDSELTAEQIEDALTAIGGVVNLGNNGKVLYIEDGQIKAASASRWSGGAVLEPLSVTANGDYTPPTGTDGFNSVHVAVPGAGNIQPLSVTQNGTYNPPSGVDGYAPVTVNVSGGAALPDMGIYGGMLTDGKYIKLGNSATYAVIPKMVGNEIIIDVSQPFEIGISFELNNISNNFNVVSGSDGSYYDKPWDQIQPSSQANTYYCAVPISSNSIIDLAVTSEDVPATVGSKYTFKMQFTGSEFIFSVTDGSNSKSVSANVSSIHSTSRKWSIGNLLQVNDRVAKDITFDMSHCYLKQNGILVWGSE